MSLRGTVVLCRNAGSPDTDRAATMPVADRAATTPVPDGAALTPPRGDASDARPPHVRCAWGIGAADWCGGLRRRRFSAAVAAAGESAGEGDRRKKLRYSLKSYGVMRHVRMGRDGHTAYCAGTASPPTDAAPFAGIGPDRRRRAVRPGLPALPSRRGGRRRFPSGRSGGRHRQAKVRSFPFSPAPKAGSPECQGLRVFPLGPGLGGASPRPRVARRKAMPLPHHPPPGEFRKPSRAFTCLRF
jgi:hypothetical protein